jgi:hypothetical protein
LGWSAAASRVMTIITSVQLCSNRSLRYSDMPRGSASVQFREYEESGGDTEINKLCHKYRQVTQDRQRTCNGTLRCVRATIVAVKNQ